MPLFQRLSIFGPSSRSLLKLSWNNVIQRQVWNPPCEFSLSVMGVTRNGATMAALAYSRTVGLVASLRKAFKISLYLYTAICLLSLASRCQATEYALGSVSLRQPLPNELGARYDCSPRMEFSNTLQCNLKNLPGGKFPHSAYSRHVDKIVGWSNIIRLPQI
jgi:hypothetical protein